MKEGSHQPAVEALARRFGHLVEQAKVRLGGLFRSGGYPAPEELCSKFWFETKVMPLPDAGDFRVTLGDEEKERIKRQITAAVETSPQVASRELWQRLYQAVSDLAERLQAYKVTDERVEHPFRDSVVTNLVRLVDVLPKLNVTGDPELERLADEVRASLLVDPQELRKSESIRSETAKKASDDLHLQLSADRRGFHAIRHCKPAHRSDQRRGSIGAIHLGGRGASSKNNVK